MSSNKALLIKNFLSNIQVDVDMAGYTKCPQNWRDIDYIPEYNKFYYICDGEGWLKIGDKEYYPKPGQLFLMPAGVIQSYSTISEFTFLKYWCHFTAKINDMNLFDVIKTPIYVDVPTNSQFSSLFQNLVLNYEKDTYSSILKTRGAMFEILAWYFEYIDIKSIDLSSYSSTRELLEVVDYIEKNLSRNITVDELSRIVHFHPNYFTRFFKDHIGYSPIQYINKLRLDKAKQLLRSTTLSVKEITDLIGFNDPSYFSRLFKKNTGLSPLEYRNGDVNIDI